MTIASIIYANYQPAQIKIDSLGIGLLSYATNDGLNLSSTQYLVVGEKENGQYSFIVDERGFAVNTTLPIRTNNQNQYAGYIDGSLYVTGNVIANGGTVLGTGGAAIGYSPWLQSDAPADIWFDGTVTIGNYFESSDNSYAMNIVQSANLTIEHSQLSIQNKEYAQMRLGILGSDIHSPAVINTPAWTNLEFHIGRDQDYFQALYSKCNIETGYDQNTGNTYTYLKLVPDQIPHYERFNNSMAPHIIIDTMGRIGIHTSSNIILNYNSLGPDPRVPQNTVYTPVSENMTLHVEGSTYAKNLLIYDNQSKTPKNIDELYVRRLGVTIPANQINPGPFANGDYTFTSNVTMTSGDLYLNGSESINYNLNVDGISTLNQIIANDAILVEVASFCNDVYINRDIIVNNSIRVRGQIFTEMLSNIYVGADGIPTSNYAWQMIDFAPSSPLLQNINFTGNGFWTPGRVGIGTNNGFNNQLSVFKYNTDIYELELHTMDPTLGYTAAAFMGHPRVASNVNGGVDGSLVIATPSLRDPNYDGSYPISGVAQNIYFFPGTDMSTLNLPVIRADNPPTLGVFNKEVSIGTYNPLSELDVRGTITFSGNLQYLDQSVTPNVITQIGLWKYNTFQNIDPYTGCNVTFNGIQFLNSFSKNVAINITPEKLYALAIGNGGIKSYDGYYTGDNRKIVPWLDSQDFLTTLNNVAPPNRKRFSLFTYGNVGMGIPIPQSTLEIKSNYSDSTMIRLFRGDNSISPDTNIDFVGSDYWRIKSNDLRKTLEIGYGSNTFADDTLPRALWMRGNQVVIGDTLQALDISPNTLDRNALLTVGGNMVVKGDINITGSFKINSVLYKNETISPGIPIPLEENDVFIAGGNIILTPSSGSSLIIGSPININVNENASLRVYPDYGLQGKQNSLIAVFHTITGNGLISIVDDTNTQRCLQFGLITPTDTKYGNGVNTTFGFYDYYKNPYLSFTPSIISATENYVGVNTKNPTAMLHIYTQNSGSNMFKLTKYVTSGQDTSAASPEMYFEKLYAQTINSTLSPTSWTIKGPNAAFGQKLGFIYSDNNTPSTEIFCFTNNGCIGIGTSQPEFALDIANIGSRGSLRLLDTGNNASPQLIFQANNYDFRMVTSNNEFIFDMQNQNDGNGDITILNINKSGNIGIKTSANPKYELNVNGDINTTGKFYINGASITGGGGTQQQGVSFQSVNIFLQPITQKPQCGGIVVNGNIATKNLFHIYNGYNANMLVLDSSDPSTETQVHFRNSMYINDQYGDPTILINNIYRMAMSNIYFQWEFWGNSTTSSEITSDHTNYKTVMLFGPSQRTGFTYEFDTLMNGSLYLNSSVPNLFLGNQGSISASNGNIIIKPNNRQYLGIGTNSPKYYTHIYNNNTVCGLHIDQYANADALHINTNNINRVTVNYAGSVGIGTTVPRAMLDINGGQIYTSTGNTSMPSYTFSSDNTTGIYLSTIGTLGISAGTRTCATFTESSVNINTNLIINTIASYGLGIPTISIIQANTLINNILELGTDLNKTLIVNSVGNIGIGSKISKSSIIYPLQVSGNIGIGGALLPTSNIYYDIGSPSQRWRDIYLSGSTIDLNGTKLSTNISNGNLQISDNNGLQSLIAKQIQLSNINSPNIVTIRIGANNNIQFTSSNVLQNNSTIIEPLSLQNNILSISTLNVTNTCNMPVTILNQSSSGDILQLFNSNQQVITFNQYGNIGIGTTTPIYPLTIFASNISNAIYIQQNNVNGNVATFINNNNNGLFINNKGYIGINTSSPSVPVHTIGEQLYDGFAKFTSNVYIRGSLEVYGDAIAHGNQVVDSDIRLKDNIKKIDNALAKLKTLSGYTFIMKNSGKKGTGLIAQEVLKVLPEAVNTENEYMGLAYGNMMGLIIESIKELSEEINRIKNS